MIPYFNTVFLIAVTCALAPVRAHSVQSDGDVDVNSVLEGVKKLHDKYKSIPELKVVYVVKYDHIADRRIFAFDRVEASYLRKGERLRTDLIGYMPVGPRLERITAWDGKVCTKLHVHREGNTNETNETKYDYYIYKRPHDHVFYYNYYVDFLFYPEASGSSAAATLLPDNTQEMKWLPRCLEKAERILAASREIEPESGVPCVVLTVPGLDSFWFDPSRDYALLRRRRCDPSTKELKDITKYSDFINIQGAWLPRRIVREEYGNITVPGTVVDQPSARKELQVVDITSDHLNDDLFLLSVPQGAVIHDAIKMVQYRYSSNAENPIVFSTEELRDVLNASNGRAKISTVMLYIGIGMISAFAILLLVRRCMLNYGN